MSIAFAYATTPFAVYCDAHVPGVECLEKCMHKHKHKHVDSNLHSIEIRLNFMLFLCIFASIIISFLILLNTHTHNNHQNLKEFAQMTSETIIGSDIAVKDPTDPLLSIMDPAPLPNV